MLKLGNFLKCKHTRQKALKAKAKKEREAAGAGDEQSGDANNREIDESAEAKDKLVETTESIQRPSGDVDTSITSPKRYSTNIAYPFKDAKSTSFPPPLSIDASIVTDKPENGQRISDRSYVTPRTSEVGSKRTSILSRKSADRGDQISRTESVRTPEVDERKDRPSKDVDQEVCTAETCRTRVYTLETCVGPSTHKASLADEINPSKLTEMINTSIKEAMQTIVKDCSIIPTAQSRKLSAASSKEAAPKKTSEVGSKRTSDVASKRTSEVGSKRTSDVASKRTSEVAPKKTTEVETTCQNINKSVCQSPPRPSTKVKCPASEPRTTKEQCHCVTLSTIRDIAERGKSHNSSRYNRTTLPCRIESTCGLTSMKLPTANDNDAAKKSKRQATRNVKTDNRCDNRRMTGNVNIYICSEANEGTQVTKKKKPKSPPCSATDSEITTEQSAATCVRSPSVCSSKLVNSIRKKRQAMKDQETRNICYSNEKCESQSTDESSNVESCTTEYRNCRLIAEKESNDDDVCETVSSELDCRNSMSTLSTRDGCCCKGTIVSGTDLLVKQSESSFPRSRFTTCVKEKLVPCSTLYPMKEVDSSDEWVEGSDYDDKHRTSRAYDPQNLLNSDSSGSSRQIQNVNYEVYRKAENVYSSRTVLNNNYRTERESEIRNAKARRNSYVNDVCAYRHKEPRNFPSNYGNEWKSTTRWRKGERRSFGSSKETIQHWSACNCIAEEEEDYICEEKKLEDVVEKDVIQKFTVCEMPKCVRKEQKALSEKVICVKVYDDTHPKNDVRPMKRVSKVIEDNDKQRDTIECPVKDTGEIHKTRKSQDMDVKKCVTAGRLSVSPTQREELHNELRKRVSENILKNQTLNNDTKQKDDRIKEKANRGSNVSDNMKLIVNEPKVDTRKPSSLESSDDKSKENPNTLKTILQPKIRSVLSEKAVDIKNKFSPKPVVPTAEQPIATEERTKPRPTLQRPRLIPQEEDTTKSPEVQIEEITVKKSAEISSEKDVPTEKPTTAEQKPPESFPMRILKKVLTIIRRRRNVPAIKMGEGTNTANEAAEKDTGERAKTDSIMSTKFESKLSASVKDEMASEITKLANKGNGANNEAEALTEESETAASKITQSEIEKPKTESGKLDDAERRESIRKQATLNKLKIPKTKLRSVIESAKKASGRKIAANETVASTNVEDKSESKEADSNEIKPKQDSISQGPEEEQEEAKDKDDVRKISQDKRTERYSSVSNNVECPAEQPSRTSVPSQDYCYQSKVECQCEPSRHSTYCVRPTRQTPCDASAGEKHSLPMHPIHVECCNTQKESNNTLIVPCISYQSPQSNYRCSRPIIRVCRSRAREECSCSGPIETVGRRLRSKDDCKCRRSMICIYCENPRERCTCRSPIRKCSSCSLPLDICKCRHSYDEEEDVRRKDPRDSRRPIIDESHCEARRTMRVTAWKPNREIRRYFDRGREDVFSESRDECRYRQKLKPYGSEELPYQRFSAFSDVMNELQQKISGSMSCTCCRKVPCCCDLINERSEEIEERNMKSPRSCRRIEQPPPTCKCSVNPPKAIQRRTMPAIRACHACNVTPCNCRKNKINQRKPRAKCYYCKSLPCTCIGTKETSKPRPCRCGDSPGRVREKEMVPCGNLIVGPKDNDGKFVRSRVSHTRVCSPPKRHQRHDNSVCVPLPEEKCR